MLAEGGGAHPGFPCCNGGVFGSQAGGAVIGAWNDVHLIGRRESGPPISKVKPCKRSPEERTKVPCNPCPSDLFSMSCPGIHF